MAQNDPRLTELQAMIESIVAHVLSRSFDERMTTWATNNPRTSWYISRENGEKPDNGIQVAGDLYNLGKFLQMSNNEKLGSKLSGFAGMYSAYISGDPIGGAMSGFQLGKAFGFSPYFGAAIGLLAGLFSPGIDKWYRPKFKTAKQAFDKMFTMDRGERDEYYMPDSFYFRTGSQGGPKKIIVKVGNNQFDDHIRESLTNAYESQLQRGLVF